MNTETKWAVGLAVVAIVLALIGWNLPQAREVVAGVTNYDAVETESLAVGSGCDNEGETCTGTNLTALRTGTCTLSMSHVASFTASTTALGHCVASNVTASDKCFVSLPGTGTAGLRTMVNNGVMLTGGVIATTTGYIGIELVNYTGAATTSYPQATTSVTYACLDS